MERKETPEQITKHYSAMMDSVNLINKGKTARETDDEWTDKLERNKEHLKIMLAKDFWTDETIGLPSVPYDMTPINEVL